MVRSDQLATSGQGRWRTWLPWRWFTSDPWRVLLGATLAGLALGMAFPGPGWAGLAWVAPGCLLLVTGGTSGSGSFRPGFLAGLAFNLVALRWLLNIPFPAGAVAGWLALSVYLAFYQGVWTWVCWRGEPRAAEGPDSGWMTTMDRLLARPWWWRTLWSLWVAAAWTGLEFIQGWFLSGFPWTALGVTQYRLVPVTQIASWTGVSGVSFLVVWVSVSMALALVRIGREPSTRWSWMSEARLPLLGLATIGCLGMMRLEPDPRGARNLRMALVQPSIPQELIWDSSQEAQRFDQIMRLSELALAGQPDVLVWPESAFPSFTEENFRAITNLVVSRGVWMIFGADDAEPRHAPDGRSRYDYYNAAFLLNSNGRLEASYRKQQLVIFGEYVPLTRWLPFLRALTPIEVGFTPGPGPVVFDLRAAGVRAAPLICFEDVFGRLVRRATAGEVDILLNLTNNGWFGRGSAQQQHAANAVFRAIENGLPLIRCTNDGLTCWIDRFGRIRQWLGRETGDLHAPGFLTVEIPLPRPGTFQERTFYRRHGDWFAGACMVAAALGLALRRRRRDPRPD